MVQKLSIHFVQKLWLKHRDLGKHSIQITDEQQQKKKDIEWLYSIQAFSSRGHKIPIAILALL